MNIHFSKTTDNWKTPSDIYRALNDEFNFNFDPCPLNENPEFDGLAIEWGTSTFCNPPYSNLKKWCEKAWQEHCKGKTVVMLIPSRTDTVAWHEYCMRATEIRFIKGRLKFGDSKNSAPFPSAIVVFRCQCDSSVGYICDTCREPDNPGVCGQLSATIGDNFKFYRMDNKTVCVYHHDKYLGCYENSSIFRDMMRYMIELKCKL